MYLAYERKQAHFSFPWMRWQSPSHLRCNLILLVTFRWTCTLRFLALPRKHGLYWAKTCHVTSNECNESTSSTAAGAYLSFGYNGQLKWQSRRSPTANTGKLGFCSAGILTQRLTDNWLIVSIYKIMLIGPAAAANDVSMTMIVRITVRMCQVIMSAMYTWVNMTGCQ